MSEVMSYKCPSCGGTLTFNSDKQKMNCSHCESEFDVEIIKQYTQEMEDARGTDNLEWNNDYQSEWNDGETSNMSMYTCPACGAQIVADETTAATKCVYCDNDTVIVQQLSGMYRPNYVIPFKVNKDSAKESLKKFYKGKLLLPKMFKQQNRIESLSGVYVPFWLFDCDTHANITYNAKKVRSYEKGNYEYTETKHYLVAREGDIGFAKVPVDGSSKAADDYMEAIEPYDYSEMIDFDTAYLSGYFADKYDVDAEQSKPRADKRIKNSAIDVFRSTVIGYSSVTTASSNIKIKQGDIKYALLPVWMLSTKYKDKIYTFSMNGQTGKFVGELPTSWSRFWTFLIGIFLILVAIGIAIVFLV